MFSKLKSLHLERSVVSPFMAVAWNIILLFVIYTLCRVEYLLENYSYFVQSVSEGHLTRLFMGGMVFDTPGIMYTNALYVLLMLLPLHWKENAAYHKVCKWLFVVVNGLAISVNLADSVYFSFTSRRTSSEVFGEFSNEGNLGKIIGTEMVSHWYLVLLAALMIWALWKLYFTPKMEIKLQSKPRYYLLQTLSLVFCGILCVSGIRGGFLNHWYLYVAAAFLAYISYKMTPQNRSMTGLKRALGLAAIVLVVSAPIGGWRHRDIRPVALSNANEYTYRPMEVALVLNTPFSVLRTLGKAVFTDPHYYDNKTELANIYTPVHKPVVTSPMRKKNVVIMIIESFGREYIGALNKEMLGKRSKSYTTFTDSLIQHSTTFRYSYCNGHKSIDGMPSVLSSIPMFIKPFVLTPQALNRVDGIASLLSKKGYSTAFFHGARTGSMGFNGFANSIGFKEYYGREDFDKDKRFHGDEDFDGYWAIWDEPFMQFYATKMSEMKQPFVTALFTASSHHPFHVPEKYQNIYKEEEMPIHKCIRYTDNALRNFFNKAKKEPWFKNTIFVMTSDHTNMSGFEEYKSDLGRFSVPIIIYDPSGEIKPGMRDAVAQQIDIVPTVLGHLGYDEPYLGFGIDVLNTPAEDTWAVNYLNGIYQYVKFGYVLQLEGMKTIGVYKLSDKLMKHNLVGKVKEQEQMERELKAIVQSYMDCMINDKLLP